MKGSGRSGWRHTGQMEFLFTATHCKMQLWWNKWLHFSCITFANTCPCPVLVSVPDTSFPVIDEGGKETPISSGSTGV